MAYSEEHEHIDGLGFWGSSFWGWRPVRERAYKRYAVMPRPRPRGRSIWNIFSGWFGGSRRQPRRQQHFGMYGGSSAGRMLRDWNF